MVASAKRLHHTSHATTHARELCEEAAAPSQTLGFQARLVCHSGELGHLGLEGTHGGLRLSSCRDGWPKALGGRTQVRQTSGVQALDCTDTSARAYAAMYDKGKKEIFLIARGKSGT